MLSGNKHKWALVLQTIMTVVAIYGVVAYRNEGELTRRLEARQRMQEALGIVLGAMDVGYWEWDLKTNKVEWSPTLYEIFGLPLNGKRSYDEWLAVIHPDDRQRAHETCNSSAETGEPYAMHYRIIMPNGSIRAILETAAMDRKGNRIVGACKVQTENESFEEMEHQAQQRLKE